MATVDSFIVVPNSRNIDTEEVTVGAALVDRQRVILMPGSLPHGCSVYHVVSLATANPANVKASPGQLYGWKILNVAADFKPIYVKLHNTAGTPTPGAGVFETIGVQAGNADDFFIPMGIAYSTGIGISIVKGIADSDSTPVAAGDCVVDLFFA